MIFSENRYTLFGIMLYGSNRTGAVEAFSTNPRWLC